MTQTSIKSLTGRRILVTRATKQAASLSRKLQDLGATIIEIPTIEIKPPPSMEELDNAIKNLKNYDWIIFTSAHGVEFFIRRMVALQVDLSLLKGAKIATIGSTTSAALQRVGRSPDYVPDEFLSEQIALGLGDLRGKKILLPRADIASGRLPRLLRNRGGIVDEVAVYRTTIPKELNSEIVKAAFKVGVDVVTFTSPSTVNNFVQVLSNEVGKCLSNVRVACIGPVTFEAARKAGIEVHVVANPHTIDALVEAIQDDVGNL